MQRFIYFCSVVNSRKIQAKLSDYLNFSGFSTRMDKILPHSVQISARIADPDLNIPPLTGVIFA